MSELDQRIQHVKQAVQDFMERQPRLCLTELFRKGEEATGVPKEWLFVAVIAQAAILIVVVGGTAWVTTCLGFVYPAYRTLKAADAPGIDDDKQWLSYWMIFGLLNLLEGYLIGPLLRLVPFWGLIKFLTLAWLYHGHTRGAEHVYELVHPLVQPLLSKEVTYVPPVPSTEHTVSGQALVAKVLQGRGIPAVNPEAAASSPYCLIKLVPKGGRAPVGVENGSAYKTSTCFRTPEPVWTAAQFVIPIENDDVFLDVVVMDKNNIGNDNYLGRARIDLEGMEDFLEWVPLEDPDGKTSWRSTDGGEVKEMSGEIQLDLGRRTL